MMMICVELPLPSNLANDRMHWATKLKAKKKYLRHCDLLWQYKQIPNPPAAPFPVSLVTVSMVVGGLMDEDNAKARLKWPVDWLRKNGYLAGDSPKELRWNGEIHQVVSRTIGYSASFRIEPYQQWECPECEERYTTAELTVTTGGQPACPDCGHEVGHE